jgi:uncharacterized membrane protein
MRKEYTPAIILYVVSAIFYIAAVLGLFIESHHWATFLLGGAVMMLLASSKLTKIGKQLREDEEREEENKE